MLTVLRVVAARKPGTSNRDRFNYVKGLMMKDLTEKEKDAIRQERGFGKKVRIRRSKNGTISVAPPNGYGPYSDCWLVLDE